MECDGVRDESLLLLYKDKIHKIIELVSEIPRAEQWCSPLPRVTAPYGYHIDPCQLTNGTFLRST